MNLKPYPEYKESGVPWLGELPTEWWAVPFKTQVDRNDGGVWGEDPDTETGTPVLRSTEQTVEGHWAITDPALRLLSTREAATFKLMTGDLLITKSSGSKAHIGKTTLVTPDVESMGAAYSNFMQRVRLSRTNSPRFFWYLMRSNAVREQITVLSTTTTGLANLTATVIGSFVVPNLPLAEQHAIADFLDRETGELDAFIADQEELIALLAERRTATIAQAVTKGLNPDAPMKNSGVDWLGDVPKHWDVGLCKHTATIALGKMLQPTARNEEDIETPYLRAANVQPQGRLDLTSVKSMWFSPSETSKLDLSAGDVVIVEGGVGGYGRAAYLDDELVGWGFQNSIIRLRPRGEFSGKFLTYAFLHLRAAGYISMTASVTSMPHFTAEKVAATMLAWPEADEQQTIATYLDRETAEIDAAIEDAREAIALSKERRAAVISAAVTGKIDVRGLVAPATSVEGVSVGIA